MFNGFDFDELYDLEADPHEMRNLARDPAYGDVLPTVRCLALVLQTTSIHEHPVALYLDAEKSQVPGTWQATTDFYTVPDRPALTVPAQAGCC